MGQIRTAVPTFTSNSVDRKRFFDVPVGIQALTETMRTPTNRVCFLVSCGYFRATRKFFAGQFHQRDIAYVARKSGVRPDQVVPNSYPRQTYLRHQKLILEFFGFSEFDEAARAFIGPEIEAMVKAQLKPRLIFSRTVEQLIREKISPPGYDALSKLILQVLNRHRHYLVSVWARS